MIEVKGKTKEEILNLCKVEIDALDMGLKPTAAAFKEILKRIDEFMEDDIVSISISKNRKYREDIEILFKFKNERQGWDLDIYDDGEINWDRRFIIDKDLEYGLNLTKDKKVVHVKSSIEQEYIEGMDLLGVLSSVQVAKIEDWTVLDLLDLIKDSELGLFLGKIAWCNFDAFYHEACCPIKESTEFADQIDYVEFSRLMQIDNCGDGDSLSDSVDVCGINEANKLITEEELTERAKNNDYPSVRYGISSTPINHIANKPIKIAKDYDIFRWNDKTNKPDIFATVPTSLSLYEIIYALLWEISFHGPPQERDKFFNGLNEQVEGIKNGTLKTVPLDIEKLIKDLKDDQEKKD